MFHATLASMQPCQQASISAASRCLPARCLTKTLTASRPCFHRVSKPLHARCMASTMHFRHVASSNQTVQARHRAGVASAVTGAKGHKPATATPPMGLSAVEGRKQMLRSVPVESFKIAGVSFDGRQELVQQLQPDQAVTLMKEPQNIYDPNAIAVQTLAGQHLGYVPKEHTDRFPHDVTFGHIYSLGPNALGLWGVTVAVRPSVPPLTVEAFPVNLASHVNLSSSLEKEDWNAIRKAAYKKAHFRCEISGGVGVEWPVECHEVWRFHDGSQTLELLGFTAVHPEVHVAKHLERQQDDKRRQQAIWMLQAMNEWTVTEAEEYWKSARQTALDRSSQQWKFDLTFLSNHGCRIPTRLQPLCRT